jgi:hypothetical protein
LGQNADKQTDQRPKDIGGHRHHRRRGFKYLATCIFVFLKKKNLLMSTLTECVCVQSRCCVLLLLSQDSNASSKILIIDIERALLFLLSVSSVSFFFIFTFFVFFVVHGLKKPLVSYFVLLISSLRRLSFFITD